MYTVVSEEDKVRGGRRVCRSVLCLLHFSFERGGHQTRQKLTLSKPSFDLILLWHWCTWFDFVAPDVVNVLAWSDVWVRPEGEGLPVFSRLSHQQGSVRLVDLLVVGVSFERLQGLVHV